MHEMVIFPILV